MKLKNLEEQIFKCKKCSGLNIPKETMSTPGYGSVNAELFAIGQSLHSYNPRTPDRQIPFVGNRNNVNDSGVILYKALDEAGYSYEKNNLYVSNILKCHPPKNRRSKPEEIGKCFPYLMKEIQIIEPKIFLTLGSDVRDFFILPRIRVGRYADLKIKNDFIYVIAYHPSYVQRYGRKYIKRYINHLVESLEKAKKEIK